MMATEDPCNVVSYLIKMIYLAFVYECVSVCLQLNNYSLTACIRSAAMLVKPHHHWIFLEHTVFTTK